jgi:murein L,D-transpeptidase YafK
MKKRIVVVLVAVIGATLAWANWPTTSLPASPKADRILVEKARRRLTLFHGDQVLKECRVSLGRHPVGAKEQEGDGKTPEGTYRVIEHKYGSTCYRALRLSYPDAQDIRRAAAAHVAPGSDIMIHGMKNGLGLLGRWHRLVDWTAGCIALTNSEIDQLFRQVDDGTIVEIRP